LAGSHRRFLEKTTGETFATPAVEIMKTLADADINITDARGWTPFLWAAHQGDVESMKLLLDRGADLQATENAGKNALMLTVYPEIHIEAARFLLDRGIFADVADRQRRSALDWAKEVIGDDDGKTLGRPKAEAVEAFRKVFEPVLKSQTIEQYETGLRGPAATARPLRLKRPGV
jgi:hypothetical protein